MTASIIEITPEDQRLARLAALAVALMALDAALPSPLPGVKPGFANIVTLLVLRRYGFATAAWVTGLRVVAGSLLFGSFLTPGFVLSASGALSSLSLLWLLRALPGRWFGMVSLSVLAAFAHTAAQLSVVALWWMPSVSLWPLVPVFAAAAWLGGLVNGLVTERLLAGREAHDCAA